MGIVLKLIFIHFMVENEKFTKKRGPISLLTEPRVQGKTVLLNGNKALCRVVQQHFYNLHADQIPKNIFRQPIRAAIYKIVIPRPARI